MAVFEYDTASQIEALRVELTRRDEAFENETGFRSSRDAIASCPEWEEIYLSLKRLERSHAEQNRKPGGCNFYIDRRRRFCASLAMAGCKHGFCSVHSAVDYEEQVGIDRERNSKLIENREKLVENDEKFENETSNRHPSSRKTNLNRRMKKMTNPDAIQYQVPVPQPDWTEVYGDPSLPILIDIGCAKGRFLQKLATTNAEKFEQMFGKHNLLGLEIYEPLVVEANRWTKKDATRKDGTSVDNLFFLACNANISLPTWSSPMPNLKAVTILFPDPWSRAKHAKRRVVTPEFVRVLANLIPSGGTVYCASDVRSLALEMQTLFLDDSSLFVLHQESMESIGEMIEDDVNDAERCSKLEQSPGIDSESDGGFKFNHIFPAHRYQWDSFATDADESNVSAVKCGDDPTTVVKRARWLAKNPYGVPTERDLVCEMKWRPVYRFVVTRV